MFVKTTFPQRRVFGARYSILAWKQQTVAKQETRKVGFDGQRNMGRRKKKWHKTKYLEAVVPTWCGAPLSTGSLIRWMLNSVGCTFKLWGLLDRLLWIVHGICPLMEDATLPCLPNTSKVFSHCCMHDGVSSTFISYKFSLRCCRRKQSWTPFVYLRKCVWHVNRFEQTCVLQRMHPTIRIGN